MSAKLATNGSMVTGLMPKTKRKRDNKANKRPKKWIDKCVLARRKRFGDNLFNYHVWSESDDEMDVCDTDGDSNQVNRRLRSGADGDEDLIFPNIFATLTADMDELDARELKAELMSAKVLLKKLMAIRRRDFAPQLDTTRAILKTLNARGYSYLDYKLTDRSRRGERCIRKGICCYAQYDEDKGVRCRRPALPFARHCAQHILYNVDQLLYVRCAAKCAGTTTQCSHPTLDILKEEPQCSYHRLVGREANESGGDRKRRKPKPMAPTRVSRRNKRRKKGDAGPSGADSVDIRLSVDDDDTSLSDTINLVPQNRPIIETTVGADTKRVIMSSPMAPAMTIPHNQLITETVSAGITPMTAPELQFSRLPPPVTNHINHIDYSEGPVPPLSPVVALDTSLVASIVADLPQLASDADFTDVLNKIPDEAFSEFLLDHQNGDIPSPEETEALEQALAMVNKDVQNLVAFAGMNGSAGFSANGVVGEVGGQSDIIGFTNWLGSLTSEQRQQLNGLIDGAIASTSLSPILKNACEAYPLGIPGPSSAPPIMKSSHPLSSAPQPIMNANNSAHIPNNGCPAIYPINPLPVAPAPHQHQEFVALSTPVPVMNSNLLLNRLTSHRS